MMITHKQNRDRGIKIHKKNKLNQTKTTIIKLQELVMIGREPFQIIKRKNSRLLILIYIYVSECKLAHNFGGCYIIGDVFIGMAQSEIDSDVIYFNSIFKLFPLLKATEKKNIEM